MCLFHRLVITALVPCAVCLPSGADEVAPKPDDTVTRPWIGPDFWANPMEDWNLSGGVAENTHSGGDRELVLLSGELTEQNGAFRVEATFHPRATKSQGGFIGFQIGLKGDFDDYRDSAIYGSGFAAGLDAQGHLFIGGAKSEEAIAKPFAGEVLLTLEGKPGEGGTHDLTLVAKRAGEEIGRFSNAGVDASWLAGPVSFTVSHDAANKAVVRSKRPAHVPSIAQKRGGDWRFGISGMKLAGPKVAAKPEQRFGPILWCQHSLDRGTLVLTAQFAPVDPKEAAKLVIDGKESTATIDPHARVARFVVKDIDATKAHPYQIRWGGDTFDGTIRSEPVDKPRLTVAAMSCNDSTGFPHQPLVENVTAQKPDLVAFLGDQIYEPIGGYGLVFGDDNTSYDDRTVLSYLRKYYMHGWTWRDLLRDTPTITIPDDHDVFHGNIWGCGGKLADRSGDIYAGAQDSGGYKMSPGFVNAVHLTQSGSLPAPADATPCDNGIGVYYTTWEYGGMDMAIVADRQFKSAPKALLPESKIRNGWPQNHAKQRPALTTPRELSVDGAELLGKRQEEFLTKWAAEKPADAKWRLVFSQTPLMCLQSIPEDEFSDGVVPSLPRMKPGEYPEGDIPKLDYDSNGWPQKKRDLAVEILAGAHAVHVTGDQHLGSTGQYGVNDWEDAGWWISSPAIANLWPRRWFPDEGGLDRREGAPKYTGRFEDGFGNRITLHAAANPYDIDREPARLFDKAVGYATLTLDRASGSITLAVWPYLSGPQRSTPDDKPYPGWPITIDPATQKRID
ncbi:MAG: alkaline phosphatase D family protein [Akkermansiaceae bacterium]|nr:alkaline phosphatase D family protein [Akkermansiaceae bacterium]